jgi:hypothetical protein
MKRALLAGCFGILASMVAQAGPCSSSTTLLALVTASNGTNGANTPNAETIVPGGCQFAGYTFSNFYLSGYNDNNYGGTQIASGSTDGSVGASQGNLANIIATFSTVPNGFMLSFSAAQNTLGFVVSTPGIVTGGSNVSSLQFEIKYLISDGTLPATSLGNTQANVNNLTFNNIGASSDAFSEQFLLNKKVQNGGTADASVFGSFVSAGLSNTSVLSTSGKIGFHSHNPINVTDNVQISIAANDQGPRTASFGSIDNVFTTVPEPLSMSLMGLGLVSLALVRRKIGKV